MNIINESGLYTLILRSRQATTPGTAQHACRKWVTGKVLPAIRKTGEYRMTITPEQQRAIQEAVAAKVAREVLDEGRALAEKRLPEQWQV